MQFVKATRCPSRPVVLNSNCKRISCRRFSASQDGSASHHITESAQYASKPMLEWQRLVDLKKIKYDEFQKSVIQKLDDMHENLQSYTPVLAPLPKVQTHQPKPEKKGLFGFFSTPEEKRPVVSTFQTNYIPSFRGDVPKGMYLYGDVGTGKTFLMDIFYNTSQVSKKRRVHFHKFMLDVHHRIHHFRRHHKEDPIPPLARDLIQDAWLICFDEFQVTDVADATLLHRLFANMYANGAVVITTSNRHPTELYKNGLQRELFLPFVDLVIERNDVVSLNSGVDYRLTGHHNTQVYYSPLDHHSQTALDHLFTKLSHHETPKAESIDVGGRNLLIPIAARGVARCTFNELCEKPLGPADFIGIAQHYHTLILENIPHLNESKLNETRRFINLIDELYNHKVKLICSAAAPPTELFSVGSISKDSKSVDASVEEEHFMFARAVSRLTEMQSEEYLQTAHKK